MNEQKIIEGLKPVCRCQGINQKTVLKYIAKGACTLEAVQQATGAGLGSCGGKQCSPRIQDLVKSTPCNG